MFSLVELIYSIACTVYVTTSLMLSAVRWFHVCPTARAHKEYYYPARRIVSVIFLTPAVLLPYILAPKNHEAWLLTKSYLLLINFFSSAVLLFAYFGKMRQWHKWRLSGQVASIITFGLVALLLIIACWPNYHLTAAVEQALLTTVTITGLLLTLYSAVAMWLVWRWTLEYSTDNYSNTDDFPLSYARRVFMVPVFQALLLWPVILFDSPTYVAVVNLLISVFNVVFLITILSPKRKESYLECVMEDADTAAKEQSEESCSKICPPQPLTSFTDIHPKDALCTRNDITADHPCHHLKDIPENTRQKIVDGIEMALEHQQLYLNPNLRLREVTEVCGYSQTYVSRVLKEQYGGFFDYVNMLRCRHVDEYMDQHPEVTKEEAITKSGFKDRQTYYRIKKILCSNERQQD